MKAINNRRIGMEIRQSKGLKGIITVAPDKSISHRGVFLGAISKGDTVIDNFLMGEDCLSTINCFRKMGITIKIEGNRVIVLGKGLRGLKVPNEMLYTGNSGTTTRLLCGLLAPQNFHSELDGDDSIRTRPMNRVIDPLCKMGAVITSTKGGYAPITIEGTNLKAIEYLMPVASAQLKSSLILAGLYAEGRTIITEPIPSRNHTELMINGFGGSIINYKSETTNSNMITINPVEELFAHEITVPGDISSAAFFMVAALIVPNSEVVIKNVGLNLTRSGIIDVLRAMGASIKIENTFDAIEPVGDIIVRSSQLHGTEIGGDLIPRLIDELPVIAVAAAFAEGTTIIKDAEELKVKEFNCIDAIEIELKKSGVNVISTHDGLIIKGGGHVQGAVFNTYNDHRIAMAMAVLALGAKGTSYIDNYKCINISYPNFFDTIKKLYIKQ